MCIYLYMTSVLVLTECGHTSWGGELHGASLLRFGGQRADPRTAFGKEAPRGSPPPDVRPHSAAPAQLHINTYISALAPEPQ